MSTNQFETHIERMDVLQFKAAQDEKLARISADRDKYVSRQQTKVERKDTWIGVACAFAAAAVLCTGIWAIWIDDDPPKSPEDYKQTDAYREQQCYENGGGWIPSDLLIGEKSICVFPGKPATAP